MCMWPFSLGLLVTGLHVLAIALGARMLSTLHCRYCGGEGAAGRSDRHSLRPLTS